MKIGTKFPKNKNAILSGCTHKGLALCKIASTGARETDICGDLLSEPASEVSDSI